MKILTALNNEELYNNLKTNIKSLKGYTLAHKDIVYKEGIIEFIKINKNIDFLLLNINIEGEIDKYSLIKEILDNNKYIEIMVVLEKDDLEFRKFLSSYNINKVLVEGSFNIDDLFLLITNNKEIKQKSIEKEIEELRKIVFNKEDNSFIGKIKKKIKDFKSSRKQNLKTKREVNITKEVNKKQDNKIISKKNKDLIKKDIKIKKGMLKRDKINFTLSEDLQKYNIDSIDITINIRK